MLHVSSRYEVDRWHGDICAVWILIVRIYPVPGWQRQAGCPAQAISTIYAQSISKYLLCIVVPFPGREHNADTAPPFLCSTHPATNTTQCWKYVLLFRTADERIGDPLNGRNKFGCNKRVWELVSVHKGNESSMCCTFDIPCQKLSKWKQIF